MDKLLKSNTTGIHISARTTSRTAPDEISNPEYMFPAFSNGEVLLGKKQGRLPAMGWNSWNAFGSKNNEVLTKAMADAIVNLGLADLGYVNVVLDDGCYKSERVNGLLSNDTMKFPNGFKALSDYIHSKGLKFGMYNDIGTNLCAGSAVGTCGYEDTDTRSYIDWGVDFLKVDNCYYLWDNATFSDSTNAKYTYAPNIRSITVSGKGLKITLIAVKDGVLIGQGAISNSGNFVSNIGTFDGTNVGTTPVGDLWCELEFTVNAPVSGEYAITVNYASGEQVGTGRWLQLAVGNKDNETRYFDNLLPLTESIISFTDSQEIFVSLNEGDNIIRLMNHRRQENTLNSYAALLEGLNKADPEHDVVLSICEWGKTQPHNWGYKVGDSWRILNDITFCVGSDGNPGLAEWSSNNTASITSQYNKAVIMDEFAGPDKGWNDPDMLVIGMNGITNIMSKTHMTMWCMMNSPIMLGMDLRRISKGDELWRIIANRDCIALNQDALGVQAKRIFCSIDNTNPDMVYITNNNRIDILAKPLANGDIALSFINLSDSRDAKEYSVDVGRIIDCIGHKMVNADKFQNAASYSIKDLWTGEDTTSTSRAFRVTGIDAYDNVTVRITPVSCAEDVFHPEDPITTEQFVTMIIGSSKGKIEPTCGGWSSGYIDYALQKGILEDYDMTNIRKPIERRSAARIVHEALLTEFRESDENDWSAAENLRDLYFCHTCVMHIAQMYVKGIMPGRDNNIFDAKGSITRQEAAAIVERMLDREQRIPQTGGREFRRKTLSPNEAAELMLNDTAAMLVDVRTKGEYKAGHIQGSIFIPLQDILNNPFSVSDRKDTPIILYCQKGYKSSIAAQALIDAGYSRIYTIPGYESYDGFYHSGSPE